MIFAKTSHSDITPGASQEPRCMHPHVQYPGQRGGQQRSNLVEERLPVTCSFTVTFTDMLKLGIDATDAKVPSRCTALMPITDENRLAVDHSMGLPSSVGRDPSLEEQKSLPQTMADALMCGCPQQENIKVERHPASKAAISILNAVDETGSYEPLMPIHSITVADRLDAQGRTIGLDENVDSTALGSAPSLGSPSLDPQGGDPRLENNISTLRRNILEFRK
ncbi:hypothetical protein Nepgr_017970 [Nepenthes gracilis]|uniref:Uncharacterized protein n=1 Tax=Nepenthes gracilis TaxID=150966 RepID=A0AAD3SSK7_NEPGR|nr:hypothetical protein Nepgr_017970 [Nepenthes gracilis]